MAAFLFIAGLFALLALRVWAGVQYAKFLDENPELNARMREQARRYGGALC